MAIYEVNDLLARPIGELSERGPAHELLSHFLGENWFTLKLQKDRQASLRQLLGELIPNEFLGRLSRAVEYEEGSFEKEPESTYDTLASPSDESEDQTTVIKVFSHQHDDIRQQENRLLVLLNKIDQNLPRQEPGALSQIASASLSFIELLGLHLKLEEEHLYSILRARVRDVEVRIPQMLYEHKLIDGRASTLTGLPKRLKESEDALAIYRVNFVSFLELLHSHMRKEEKILFPRAEDILTDEEKSALLKASSLLPRREGRQT